MNLDIYNKIFIHNLKIEMSIGIHAEEKLSPQSVIISLVAYLNIGPAAQDSIEYTVCYETMIDKIRILAANGHVNLLETFAEQIALLALTDENIHTVEISVEKPNLLNAKAVGVQIRRTKVLT